jgi:hypothetical protein
MTKIFAAIAILGAAMGWFFASNPVLSGLGKALFGTFFIMVFLVKLAAFWSKERPETTHDHGGLMGKGGHDHGHGH